MGKLIAKKIKGMSWTAKISLMLVFTWMFSYIVAAGFSLRNLFMNHASVDTSCIIGVKE